MYTVDELDTKLVDSVNVDMSYKRRHENGHLLLQNSIYPRLDESNTNQLSPFRSDLSSLFNTSTCSSLNLSSILRRDSGVNSETSSALEPFLDTDVIDKGESNECLYQQSSLDNQLQTRSTQLEGVEDFHSSNFANRITSADPEILNNVVETNSQIQHNHSLDTYATANQLLQCQNLYTADKFLEVCGGSNARHDGVHQHHFYTKQSDGRHNLICINKHPTTTRRTSRKSKNFMNKKSNKSNTALEESLYSKYTSCRWRLVYLCFLARFVQTALRQCMGVAVIGMTMKKSLLTDALSSPDGTSNSSEINITKTLPDQTSDFEWSSSFEGVILTSFNTGSIITPIIVGYLTTRHGGTKLMTLCLMAGGMLTVCLPVAAKINPACIIVIRVLTGVALSGTDSLIQAMLARWAPLSEKASMSVCAYTGLSSAGVLTFLVCGYIVSIGGEGNGWPYIFYIFGGLCLLLAPLWYLTVYNSPDSHPGITKKELAIIAFNKQPENYETDKEHLNPPWRRMLLSPAVWVILMGHITHKWILSFMLSYLPRYFSDMFQFDMKTDGLFSSLPFAGRILSGLAAGFLSDWMFRNGVSTVKTRKFFQATGCWGCAACSLIIAFVPSMSNAWSISLLVLALSSQDLTSVAFRINLLDIAPKYAGLLNGVLSTVATLTSLPAPVITSLLISGGSRHGWQIVFCLVAGLNIIGGAIFLMFAKGEVQSWAKATYGHTSKQLESKMNIFTLDIGCKTNPGIYKVINGRVLREVKSLPVNIQKQSSHQKVQISRRATFDVTSMIKRVQNDVFINLALADM